MKKYMAGLMAMIFAGFSVASQAQVLSAWHYDGLADGSGRSAAVSTGLVAGVAWGNTTMCSVQGEALLWTPPDLTKAGDFSDVTLGDYSGKEGGIFRLEMDYVSASMVNTFAAHEESKTAIGIKSSVGNSETFRLRYDGHTNVMVVTELEGVITTNYVDRNQFTIDWGNTPIFVVPGNILGTNIHVNALYDIVAGTVSADITYDGVTTNAYNGTLPDKFNLETLRWTVQSNNGGAHWQMDDTVVTDNIVLTMLQAPNEPAPPPPLSGLIEEWTFDTEPDGTILNGVVNTAPEPYGLATWGAGKAWNFTTNGVLRFENGGTETLYRKANVSQVGSTEGQYELTWEFPRVNVLGALANGAVISFGLRDSAESKSSFEVRLTSQNGSLILQQKIGTVATTMVDFGTQVLSNLSVRTVADYDDDTIDVYYKLGDATEVLGASGISMYKSAEAEASLDIIYMIAVTKSKNLGPDDFYELDNLRLTALYVPGVTPETLYSDWLGDFTLGTQTNLTDDADGDLLDNLGEYAFGGDPSDPTDQGNTPWAMQTMVGDTNYLEYIYFERDDATTRGLTSILNVGTDLITADWTTTGIEFVGSGASTVPGFNAVTNRIPTVEAAQFLRLQIEFTP